MVIILDLTNQCPTQRFRDKMLVHENLCLKIVMTPAKHSLVIMNLHYIGHNEQLLTMPTYGYLSLCGQS